MKECRKTLQQEAEGLPESTDLGPAEFSEFSGKHSDWTTLQLRGSALL